jgi:hypothetical protein
MCMCIDVYIYIYIYMVANLILKHISLVWNFETLLQENMGYLIHLSSLFQAGIRVPIVLNILDTYPFFQYFSFSFVNNFCIAHASFLQQNFFMRDSNKNLLYLFSGILSYLCVYSQCRSRTFFGGWKDYFCVLLM